VSTLTLNGGDHATENRQAGLKELAAPGRLDGIGTILELRSTTAHLVEHVKPELRSLALMIRRVLTRL
jgi:hypothetical protein